MKRKRNNKHHIIRTTQTKKLMNSITANINPTTIKNPCIYQSVPEGSDHTGASALGRRRHRAEGAPLRVGTGASSWDTSPTHAPTDALGFFAFWERQVYAGCAALAALKAKSRARRRSQYDYCYS